MSSTRKSAQALGVEASRPHFRGMAILDAKFATIVPGQGEHDLWIRLSCLAKGKRLLIKSRGTRVLKKWLAMPGARLVDGCGLSDGERLTLWVELPAPEKRTQGPVLGVDVGVTKLLATSDGELLGTEFKALRDKIRRRKPGSKGRKRARRERDQLICEVTRQLPWDEVRAVAFEDLSGIKRGKKAGRGRAFRRAVAAWRVRAVEQRLACLAAEAGVLAIPVPAWGNSTTCPRCRDRHRSNRQGCQFRCRHCGFEGDADHVGALAAKRLGEERLEARLAADREERAAAAAKREQRKAAALRRGQATAAKWREKKAAAVSAEHTHDSSNRGAQSPAARTPSGSAPIRDQACGGAPRQENPEGGRSRGSRRKAAGRRGGDTTDARSDYLGDNCQVQSKDGRVLALDGNSDKP